jgi:hypothetical protein
LRLRWTRIRDLKRRFGGLQVSGLDSGLQHDVADVIEALAARAVE